MNVLRPVILSFALCLSFSALAEGFQLFDLSKSGKQQDSSNLNQEQMVGAMSELSPEAIKALLEQKLPGIEISSVEPSPKQGMYQAFYNGQLLYISTDGQFLFTGNMLGLSGEQPMNHTEEAMSIKSAELSPERAATIDSIKEEDMVVFKADKEEYAITVFTDVDCAYCRKLHKEVPQLNARGITVRYLAFPRAGVGSSAYDKLVSVWCAEDKPMAMDNAKLKRQFSPKTCPNPVASQYNLTRKLGLNGTPALILPDGELIAGYVPFEELHKHLKSKSDPSETAGK